MRTLRLVRNPPSCPSSRIAASTPLVRACLRPRASWSCEREPSNPDAGEAGWPLVGLRRRSKNEAVEDCCASKDALGARHNQTDANMRKRSFMLLDSGLPDQGKMHQMVKTRKGHVFHLAAGPGRFSVISTQETFRSLVRKTSFMRKRIVRYFHVLISVLVVTLAGTARAQDWPQW